MTYKTKETALKHLRDGENFKNKTFDLFRNDKEVLAEVARKNVSFLLEHQEYSSDRDIVRASVEGQGNTLRFASDKLKDDRDIVLIAINNNPHAISSASDRLQDDKELALLAVGRRGDAIRFVSDRLRSDTEVFNTAFSNDGWVIKYGNDEFRNNRENALKAVKCSYTAIKVLEESFRDDKQVILAAIDKQTNAVGVYVLRYASEEIQLLCKDKDPVETLTKAINYDNLRKKLAPSSVEQPKQKMKI